MSGYDDDTVEPIEPSPQLRASYGAPVQIVDDEESDDEGEGA